MCHSSIFIKNIPAHHQLESFNCLNQYVEAFDSLTNMETADPLAYVRLITLAENVDTLHRLTQSQKQSIQTPLQIQT